ncbi:acyl-CoA reductase [Lewinella sp. JB7]|uniref:acyl-CoA reductase n=1 Tax=Lewinella sp. JB7 TaxID=2962887 RepID=UPI0020C98BCC|nr:acyl-CoA reductase [Lewinella sp. JB7]MCP9235500.1 acyl-CoA reductase [Lewinella sp. JB7]
MTSEDRISTLLQLARHLNSAEDEFLTALMKRTEFNNNWLTVANQQRALQAVTETFLDEEKLCAWLAAYPDIAPAFPPRKTVGLVLAGNIPLVGLHDVFSVYLAGHRAQIKLSSKDPYVLPYLLRLLSEYDDRAADYFAVVEHLANFDAIIATGSNNSARYFESYFGKYPHVIRRNRNAVAVLTGEETSEELDRLGDDVFAYFGLGCRNVSKIYVPRGYDFTPLLERFHEWKGYQNHVKWKNNFDYNFALLTLNKEPFYHNGAIIIRESDQLASHIAGLYFAYYDDVAAVTQELSDRNGEIQLVVARPGLLELPTFDFGRAQQPELSDYADGVDTMAFLSTGL